LDGQPLNELDSPMVATDTKFDFWHGIYPYGALAVVGLALTGMADAIARLLARGLPVRAEVSSRGTGHQVFADLAPTIISRTGMVLVAVAVLAPLIVRWRIGELAEDRSSKIGAAVGIVATGFWYGWLSNPHNGFPTNARFHWVDFLTYHSDNFAYPAGRIPHRIFYEVPYVWQGITAALCALLCYTIARQLGLRSWTATAACLTPAIAGNLLLFANTAEDLLLNTALLLAVVSAVLSRRPVLVGVALAAAVLGRPSFIIFFGCLGAAEAAVFLRAKRWPRLAEWRFVVESLVVATVITAGFQVLFTKLGNRYFLVEGRLVDMTLADKAVVQVIDGFRISAFSGVYLLHLLWILPLVYLLTAPVAVVNASKQRLAVESGIYFSLFAMVGHLLIHESTPFMYYNVRYLTYIFPFFFLLSWAAFAGWSPGKSPAVRVVFVLLITLGPVTFPGKPLEVKNSIEQRPELELLEIQDELRELADQRPVFLDFGARSSRNYVGYVMRDNPSFIQALGDGVGDREGIIISLRSEPWSSEEPDLSTETYVVFNVVSVD
jgi:hypothetical protein